MIAEPVGTYDPVPFCRPGHPLAAVEPQGIKVLREYPVITTEMPRWYTDRWEAGLPLDPQLAGELAERGRSVQVPHLATSSLRRSCWSP